MLMNGNFTKLVKGITWIWGQKKRVLQTIWIQEILAQKFFLHAWNLLLQHVLSACVTSLHENMSVTSFTTDRNSIQQRRSKTVTANGHASTSPPASATA